MARKLTLPRLSVKVLSALFALIAALFTATDAHAVSSTIVINQIFGAGGNSGSSLNADFIELYNLTSSAINISGYSIQYASSGGTTATVNLLPSGASIPAHGYYTAAATPSATVGACFAEDAVVSTIAFSGTSGKIYLVSSTTALTAAQIAAPDNATTSPTVVDMIGYGVATVYEGSGPAPIETVTTGDIRTNFIDTDNNAADFTANTVSASNIHTSTTPAAHTSCVSTPPTATAAATPSTQVQGSAVLFTVKVTPGTGTGITVTADLSGIGGSATQPLNDTGTNGDVTSGDNTYSYSYTLPSNTTIKSYSIPFTVTDTQLDSVTVSPVTLIVNSSVAVTPIHTLQAAPSTYIGTNVNVQGIVTAIRATGFYLETPTGSQNSPLTVSEGIYVNTGTTPPASVVVGNSLQVQGTLNYSVATATGYLARALEIDSPMGYSVQATGQTLPTAVALTSTNLSPTGTTTQLFNYQSMLLSAASLTSTSGTSGTLTETTETYVSNGQFYSELTGVAQPFRAAGADSRDAAPTAGAPSNWTRWAAPTNLIGVDTLSITGQTAVDLVTGSTLANVAGVLDYTSGQPVLMTTAAPTVTGPSNSASSATSANSTQLTVATLNMNRFYDTETGVTGAVTIGSAAYNGRLAKASNAIRNSLGFPDVIALQEVESATELTALATQITTDAATASQTNPAYVGTMGTVGPNGYGNGFLTKSTKVTVGSSASFGVGCGSYCYTNPNTGTTGAIWDTPPLYINAKVARGSNPSNAYALYILNAEMLPATGINSNVVSGLSTVGAGVRAKRLAQAQQLAGSVVTLGTSQPILLAGNMNAYEFSDGYVDVNGILTNTQVAQNTVVSYNSNTYNTTLTNLVPSLAATTRYTANESGVSDALDHIYISSNTPTGTTIQAVHIDSDYNATALNTTTTPYRTSSRDALVATVQVPQLSTVLSFNPALSSTVAFGSVVVNTTSASKPVVVTNTNTTTAISITSIVASTGYSQTNNCGSSIAALGSCTINITFSPTTAASTTGTVVLTDSDITGTQTISLSGTGYNLIATTPVLTANPVTPVVSQPTTLTATIGGNGVTAPTGSVIFKDGTNALNGPTGTAVSPSGTNATVSYTVTAGFTSGTHSLSAVYSGDTVYATGTGTGSVTPTAITSFTAVGVSPTTSLLGTSVSLTATVTSNLGTPTGTVQFYNNVTTPIGTPQTLVNGTVTYPTTALSLGNNSITATYTPNIGAVYAWPSSTSSAVPAVVGQPDFSLYLSNATIVVGASQKSGTATLAVVAVNGLATTVNFSCSGLPVNSSCTFTPASLTTSVSTPAASTTLTINTQAAANHAPHLGFEKGDGLAIAFTLLMAPFAFRKRKQALRLLVLMVALLAGMQMLTGCGTGGTPSGSNTITVTATATTGQTHTATFTLVTQ
jgi:endonuclease/exonuclease/phosphatase family metal-dependent hydrolase